MSRPPYFVSSLLSLFSPKHRCLSCQFRGLQAPQLSRRNISSAPQTPQKENGKVPEQRGDTSGDYGRMPEPLNYPLGLARPPQEGENTGVDARTLRQRRDDFVDHEKHFARRKELTKQVAKPYFREWTQTGYYKGKTFIANQRLFKSDKALYFPNLYGRTLLADNPLRDTTPVLRGKISVVSLFSSLWAERQVASFVGLEQNPTLHQLLKESGGIAQKVEVNAEDNILKEWLVRMFMGSMRRKFPQEQHGRYFVVRKGFTGILKERIGMMNSKVGYVYLLDEKCKIRWAGNSIAAESELESLNNGLRKLITEKKTGANTVSAPKKKILTEAASGLGNKEAIPV